MKLSHEDIKTLQELFPLKSTSYFISISSSFNSLETLIEYLLNEPNDLHEPINLNIKEFILNTKTTKQFYKQEITIKEMHIYNFPELFNNTYIPDTNPQVYREEAQKLYEKAKKINPTLFQKEASGYFNEEKEKIIEKARDTNYKAALIILKRVLNSGFLDFHGLLVKESILFLEDYLWYYKPKKLTIVTGRSKRIKPKIIELLKKKGFDVFANETIITAQKK